MKTISFSKQDSLLLEQVRRTSAASRALAMMTSVAKNALLMLIAEELRSASGEIEKANMVDINNEKAALEKKSQTGAAPSLRSGVNDRLVFGADRLEASVREVENVAGLRDFVGDIIEQVERPNGLRLERVRVPLGVVMMIYEARPNVTIDAVILCLKSGNAVILKGGSEALHTNRAIVAAICRALDRAGVSHDTVMFVDSSDRSVVGELLQMKGLIDVVIPRGGKGLIDYVSRESLVPVIETGASVVHMYIDEDGDVAKAVTLAVNAKTRRVGICNTLDVLLVHVSVADEFVCGLAKELKASSVKGGQPVVELRCDRQLIDILDDAGEDAGADYLSIRELDPAKDFDTEFLDYVLTVHVVESFDEAIEHIAVHSLKHSECIVTENAARAEEFLNRVDSACVYWNASTQFSDGAQFGLGAEIGISTQKLHVRGPFALEGLTTYKWKIRGDGQVRPG